MARDELHLWGGAFGVLRPRSDTSQCSLLTLDFKRQFILFYCATHHFHCPPGDSVIIGTNSCTEVNGPLTFSQSSGSFRVIGVLGEVNR